MGAPVIHIVDSIGTKINEGIELLRSYGMILRRAGKLSGVVPQISIVCGPNNGLSALVSSITDFTIIVDGIGEFGVNSSQKISEEEEKHVDASMFSDSFYSSKNGNANFRVEKEEEAFELAKKVLEYLPSNNLETPWNSMEDVNLNFEKKNLDEMIDNENHSMDEVINAIADSNSVLEINKEFVEAFKTSFVRINGLAVGVISNSFIKSKVNNEGAIKVANFVRLCDCFNIPILSLVDTKGFSVSLEEEKKGLLRNIGKLLYSLIDASVPKLSLIIGEAYGAGYVALAGKEAAFDVTLAWPSAKVALTNPEVLIKASFREEILAAANPKIKEKEVIKEHLNDMVCPYKAAELGLIDDIIRPSETKQRVFALLDMLQSKRELSYPKKHGSKLV
jgi:propionyl-CoA carboxylase beta chain/acetyl-CoA/propionyl-CoA carboxylase